MCIACYKDTTARNNNFCTACIPNAFILDGSMGDCKCKADYYYDKTAVKCLRCHSFCKEGCSGPTPSDCFECKQGYPRWNGECKTGCNVIDFPFNTTYVFSAKENLCKPCSDYQYTLNSVQCQPQPYPTKLKNYNNKYLILEFS